MQPVQYRKAPLLSGALGIYCQLKQLGGLALLPLFETRMTSREQTL